MGESLGSRGEQSEQIVERVTAEHVEAVTAPVSESDQSVEASEPAPNSEVQFIGMTLLPRRAYRRPISFTRVGFS